jgi:hypothetical protein
MLVLEDGELDCTWIYGSFITQNVDSMDTFTLITAARRTKFQDNLL